MNPLTAPYTQLTQQCALACGHTVIDRIQIARLFSGVWRNDITLITTSKYKQSRYLTDTSVYKHVLVSVWTSKAWLVGNNE